ncbi:MAG: threonylcarbamoyl-AMP synthase [Bacteroidia bacterium]|nr:threonylcarbamoyl-AMP synthase [Bacteroidia bacterium]
MQYIELNNQNPDDRRIKEIAEEIRDGAIIVFPTDTIYAIGCSLLNRKGIEAICKIFGKKPEKANLSIICHDLKNISDYTIQFNAVTFKMLKHNLPGPFTFILKANNEVPKLFLNKKKTIGIRVPDNNIARSIVEALGHPLVSSSLKKLEGDEQQFITEPGEIYDAFKNHADIIISGGAGGLEPSTIVDCTGDVPEITRQGAGELIG